jgi:hypothetical protein
MKNFYLTLVLFLWFSSFLSAQNTINNGYNGSSIASIGASGSNFYAQSFIATVNEVSKFGVFLTEIESQGELILAIAADNGSGAPNVNAPLYEGTLKNPSTTGAWFYEEGINVLLTVGQKYWIVIDGYNNAGATGRSSVGRSTNYTNTGEGMIYSNNAGSNWSSLPSMPLAIFVEGLTVVIDENNGYNGNSISSIGASGSNFYAQSFIANINEISKFGVFLTEIDSQGELILAIAADNGSGAPNVSAPLYEGTLKNPSTTGAWFYEEGISIPVTIGQKYWIVIDGYNNVGATGRSSVGKSNNYTNTGEGMIYSNSAGSSWGSIPSIPLAIYVSGSSAVIDENTSFNGTFVSSIGQTGSDFYAQSFIANLDTITKFGAVIKEIDVQGEVVIAIAADNGSGSPNVTSPLYEGALINPSTVGKWYYEGGIKVPVTVGQKYWIVIDGYNNAGATGRSGVGLSSNYTNTGEGMIYSNAAGSSWNSIPSMPLAIYVSGIRKFPVTFAVTDTTGGDTIAVEGVTISFEKYGDKMTDVTGLAVYDSVYYAGDDTIDWTATKMGYYTQTGSIVVSDTTTISIVLEPIPHTVTFIVSEPDGIPIEGAMVDLDGYGTKYTTESGLAVFEPVYLANNPGIPYNVSATGYSSAEGNVIVTSDIVREITLTRLSYTITFHVSHGGDNVVGANVDLTGNGAEITDASGLAVFENVEYSFGEGVTYEVTGTGINTADGNVVVDMDKTVDVVVSYVNGIHETLSEKVSVFPNPAKDVVNIKLLEEISTIDIVTMQGSIVRTVPGDGKNAQLKVSELSNGNYLLIIHTEKNTYVEPLIISE